MSETQIDLKIDGPVARATFSTEGGLNVLSSALLDRVAEVVAKVKAAEGVRALIVGATGKVFVAGANIKELAQLDQTGAAAIAQKGHRTFNTLAELPCVTIARLHGAALGGGMEIALACDFRVALASAKVGLPETSLGLIPGWAGIGRMLVLAGPAVTKRLVFSAGVIAASAAKQFGLIDEVADDEAGLDAKIEEMLGQFRRGAPNGIAMTKQALRSGDEVKAFADCFGHPDAKEGMTAFIEKRSAAWMER
jgi:enoyl-CoA hydratase